MARIFTPKIVTANDLLDGEVIYLAADATWTKHMSKAALFTDQPAAELALEKASMQAGLAVGAYLADARPSTQGPEPTHFREEFRRRGPSNYAHGKQVELTNV